MKLSISLLLPALLGAASAASDATVYIFQGDEWPNTSKPPTLSPEQARLVFAQRLGIAQYHGLEDASESTLSYINKFGGNRNSLFQDSPKDKVRELMLIVEGVSSKTAEPLLNAWSSSNPTFMIANPPSLKANKKLVGDLNQQSGQKGQNCPFEDAINPFDEECWNGQSKVMHLDLGHMKDVFIEQFMSAQGQLLNFAKMGEMNIVVVLMLESSRSSKGPAKPWGVYEMVMGWNRRQVAEEPITDSSSEFPSSPTVYPKQFKASNASDNSTFEPITGVNPMCHSSLDSCVSSTNNCSGHGACYKKYGSVNDTTGECFTCGCMVTNETFKYGDGRRTGWRYQSWGGSACHKKDVSGPFWLIGIFSIVMVGLVSWAVGLMYSIGEEKLPGVIGAGVSSKAR